MPYAVQLDVDGGTQAVLDEIDGRLTAAGFARTIRGLAAVHHMALGVYADLPEGLDAALGSFAASIRPVHLRLSSLGVFPGTMGVLFLGPVTTEDLLQLHRRFHDALPGLARLNSAYYRPGAWVPHVTLALDVPAPRIPAAMMAASAGWQPLDIVVDQLRLTEFEPVVTRLVRRLAG